MTILRRRDGGLRFANPPYSVSEDDLGRSHQPPEVSRLRETPLEAGNSTPTSATLATGSNAPTTGQLSLEGSIGRKVRNLRQRLQLTASEVAAEAGLSTGMLSKIENGGTSPSLATLQALARALNVPLTSFFADFEERHNCSTSAPARAF